MTNFRQALNNAQREDYRPLVPHVAMIRIIAKKFCAFAGYGEFIITPGVAIQETWSLEDYSADKYTSQIYYDFLTDNGEPYRFVWREFIFAAQRVLPCFQKPDLITATRVLSDLAGCYAPARIDFYPAIVAAYEEYSKYAQSPPISSQAMDDMPRIYRVSRFY